MNTPITITSLASDMAFIKSAAIKNSTDYYVSIIVTKDESDKYQYSYFVRFKYCNMYTIFGELMKDAETAECAAVIDGVYLCDGRLYNENTKLPYAIRGYTVGDNSSLLFELSTFLNPQDDRSLYVKVNQLLATAPIKKATYQKIQNCLKLSDGNNSVSGYPVYPIIIESVKQGSPCYVDVFTNNGTDTSSLNKTILPETDTDLSLLTIPCLIVQ